MSPSTRSARTPQRGSPRSTSARSSVHLGSVGLSADAVGVHISIWLVLLIAGGLTALAGILIGLPTLRLRGDYLAIVTLGFGEIIPQVVRNGDSFGGFNLTNGSFGISPIDSPGFGEVGSRSACRSASSSPSTARAGSTGSHSRCC